MLVSVLMCLMGAMLVAKLFPETPTGRRLHQVLVEAPARWLSSTRARRMLWGVALVTALGLIWSHGIPLALPLDLLASFETSAVLELIAALAASAVLLRSRAAWAACRNFLAGVWGRIALIGAGRPRARSARTTPARRAAARSATDEDEPGRAYAFA